MSQKEGIEIVDALLSLPLVLTRVLKQQGEIKSLAEKIARYKDAIFLGRKFHTPIAHEGSLKLKEVAYIHAEAYAGGELKHGPIAMLDPEFPIIALCPHDDVYEKMASNVEEVKARKAPVFAFATEGDTHIASLADVTILMPAVHPIVQPIVTTVYLHMLAYYVGVAKGLNVDRPRNLAKSVTVE
jgi:glucosamine--fructose-6-phosphate aminotransferase (isomerizing)